MREGRAAKTAQTVAFARAIETQRPRAERLFEDPYAVRFLGSDGRWILRLLGHTILRRPILACIDRLAPGLLPYAVARTTFIDEALARALRRGTAQILILGAGYDTRALRVAGIESATVFEVDHPDTQGEKYRRLGSDLEAIRQRVRLVDVDFDRQDLGERLRSAGFQFEEPSFVIWEGVTQYLPEAAVDATLRVLAMTAPGSEIVFTYVDRALIDGSRTFPGGRRLLLAVRLMGEPFRFGLKSGETAGYLGERGFELIEDIGGDDFSERYFTALGRNDRATDTERVARARVAPDRSPSTGR